MGGVPEVKWARYDDCVIHVRKSHVPRFELEIGAESSLFDLMKISYEDFSALPIEKKMHHIRDYAKKRLKDGEPFGGLKKKPNRNIRCRFKFVCILICRPKKKQN